MLKLDGVRLKKERTLDHLLPLQNTHNAILVVSNNMWGNELLGRDLSAFLV